MSKTQSLKTVLAIIIIILITVWATKIFSPPATGPAEEVATADAPAHITFSSPSSEAGQEQVVPALAFTFDDLLDAIEWVESKGDPWAVGDNGNAVGAYQIHKIYVDDVNRIPWRKQKVANLPRDYKYSDRYSKEKSRTMATIYLKHYGGTFEGMARKHNGGPNGHKKESTKKYWLKVKARMEAK